MAADGFAAIGSDVRLEVLKVLVRAGVKGLTVGELQQRTALPPSTLSHHLRTLTNAGLAEQSKHGRSVVTKARYARLEELAHYILSECCADGEKTLELGSGHAD